MPEYGCPDYLGKMNSKGRESYVKNLVQRVSEYLEKRKIRKIWRNLMSFLACLVVFATTYALILPAITLESGNTCGKTEHTHSEDCYQRELACQLEEGESHTHTDACYTAQLICTRAEHTHSEDCTAETQATEERETESSDELPSEESPSDPSTDDPSEESSTSPEPSDEPSDSSEVSEPSSENEPSESGQTDLPEPLAETAETVKGETPPGTIINVFDYWTQTPDAVDQGEWYDRPDDGINAGHAMKFHYDSKPKDYKYDSWNIWTGNNHAWNEADHVYQNIVEPTLTGSYPKLNQQTTGSNESLAYLFDPNTENSYRAVYRNVGNLLQIDQDGYHYYDSTKNYAYLCPPDGKSSSNKQFILYADKAVDKGQFFPFNDYATAKNTSENCNGKDERLRHYFGLTLTARFYQRPNGVTYNNTPITFEFSGDDDVWIFIDDVLVADLGGIHDAANVVIDFQSGNVTVNAGKYEGESTTIKAAFETAGKATETEWRGNTFADDTYHVLRFFYLERGAAASNLMVKYNLVSFPTSGVTKVDQAGDTVSDAEFTLYQADENYNIQYKDGKPVEVCRETTSDNGEMIFESNDEPYSTEALKKKFGLYYVLRETVIPTGYRSVGRDIQLRILDDPNGVNDVMVCENTPQSGVWASPTLQVIAPTALKKVKGGFVQYYMPDGTINGTLFAVVLKRVGEDLTAQDSWRPIYGTAEEGYTIVDTGNDFVQAAIDTAEKYVESQNVFRLAPSGQMQAMLSGMPGDIRDYYFILNSIGGDVNNTQYTLAYYWSSATNWSDVNSTNTWRIDDYDEDNPFDRAFGSTLQVPNMINRLAVQKRNKKGELINGALFGMYKVEEREDGIFYIADDDTLIRLGTSVTIDADSGVLTTAEGKTITPKWLEETVAADQNHFKEDGTADFSQIVAGQYVVREVKAPTGYASNPSEILVLVTGNAVYANAGTADDGVAVARSPGYLASNLHSFASIGDIENTLCWIYTRLRITDVSNDFQAFTADASSDRWKYITKNFAADFKEDTVALGSSNALTTYMKYAFGDGGLLYSFLNNNAEVVETLGKDKVSPNLSELPRRHYTKIGWSYLEIMQNYAYGEVVKGRYANYEDWKGDLSVLFSRSVYVQVTDPKLPSRIEISKIVENAPADKVNDTFPIQITISQETGSLDSSIARTPVSGTFQYAVYNIDADGNRTKVDDYNLDLDAAGTGTIVGLKHGQVAVIEGLPGEAWYDLTELNAGSYNTTIKTTAGTEVREEDGKQTEGQLYWEVAETAANNLTSVVFTNSYLPTLTIWKMDATRPNVFLPNAEFTLSRTENGETQYFDGKNWNTVAAEDEAPVLRSDVQGGIYLKEFLDGSYTLKEVKAPAGYYPLNHAIQIEVADGKFQHITINGEDSSIVKIDEEDATQLRVFNNGGVVMPNTGGVGKEWIQIGGFLLMLCAASLLWLHFKRKTQKI